MNEWQQIHQNTCDLYSILREDLDKAEYVDNENNFGVFQESDLFIKEVQNNFYSKIEKMLKLLNEQCKKYKTILEFFERYQIEGNNYYESNSKNINPNFNKGNNLATILEYIQCLDDTYNNYSNEYEKIKNIIENFSYNLSKDETTTNYHSLIDYEFINTSQITIVLENIEKRIEEFKY